MKWIDALLPEQKEFYIKGRGHGLNEELLTDVTIEFEYFLDEGFFVYVNGEFYEHVEDGDWESYWQEQEENGVERVVLLDWYGAVLHETQPKTPESVKHVSCDIFNVLVTNKEFVYLEQFRHMPEYYNEQESSSFVISLSANMIRLSRLTLDSDNVIVWLKQKLKAMPWVNEVRIGIWS